MQIIYEKGKRDRTHTMCISAYRMNVEKIGKEKRRRRRRKREERETCRTERNTTNT
jgi:hypothetical protein